MLSIFALVGLQLYHGKLLRKCIKEMTSVEQRLADSAAKRAFNDNPGHYEQFFVRIALLALPMRQGLCNGRASVRPPVCRSVCGVDGSRLSIYICRRRPSTSASEQHRCYHPMRIDANLLLSPIICVMLSDFKFNTPP